MSIPAERSPRWEEGGASTRVRSSTPSHDVGTTTEALTDDLLVEIISRVPSRQRWRCKCVCKSWLRLARTLPQSLAGFFCTTTSEERFPRTALHFFNASGWPARPLIYPSFAFLPSHQQIDLLDCCNGLLCRWYGVSSLPDDEFSYVYVVCNPVTEQWVALPDCPSHSRWADSQGTARLGFDPAVSSHFHVFMLLVGAGCYPNKPITGVDVYSSETGRWVHKEKGCDVDVRLAGPHCETVFLNGYLHFHSVDAGSNPSLAVMDTDGETWMNIDVPGNQDLCCSFIQHSQGRLHYASFSSDYNLIDLVVYVLEDYDNKQWALKHRVEVSDLFPEWVIVDDLDVDFDWLAIHPECIVIFFTAGAEKASMWYNMDNQRSGHIRLLGIGHGQSPYLSYAPLYSELQSLHM